MRQAGRCHRSHRALHRQVAPAEAHQTGGVGAAFGMHVLYRAVGVIRVQTAVIMMMMLCVLPVLNGMA